MVPVTIADGMSLCAVVEVHMHVFIHVQASSSGAVPKELVKALKRRKMYARKGGRKGEGERSQRHQSCCEQNR